MADAIVYTVVTKPGGCDGMDHTDKGGKVVYVSLTREAIPETYKRDTRYTVKPEVYDLDIVASEALNRLPLVEKFAITRMFERKRG
jgi:hypothetical protein